MKQLRFGENIEASATEQGKWVQARRLILSQEAGQLG